MRAIILDDAIESTLVQFRYFPLFAFKRVIGTFYELHGFVLNGFSKVFLNLNAVEFH